MRSSIGIAVALTVVTLSPVSASSGSSSGLSAEEAWNSVSGTLRGSHTSMEYQNQVARMNDFTFLRTSLDVRDLVKDGRLVPMYGNKDYRLANVSHPAARPIMKTFVERLGAEFHATCGAPLTVTSLTRPLNEQPRNASDLSVHPAGMAVDLRIPTSTSCRRWLESSLLSLERRGVLDVTRERRPAHYHIAVFPDAYSAYVAPLIAEETRAAALKAKIDAETEALLAATPVPTAEKKPTTASIAPGPGPLATLLWLVVTMSGVTALLLTIRNRPAPIRVGDKSPIKDRRQS